MIISCPSCNAGFFVSPTQIGATGRRVKCSKCKNVWHATVPLDSIPKEDVIAQRLVTQNIVTGANLPAIIPIKISYLLFAMPAIFLMLIFATIWVLYPSLTKNFGLCGPMCIENGVRIEEVSYDFEKVTNKVIIEYNIANRSNQRVTVPSVRFNLLDDNNITLRSLKSEQKDIILEPNVSIRGQASFDNVSQNAKYVNMALGSTIKFWFR